MEAGINLADAFCDLSRSSLHEITDHSPNFLHARACPSVRCLFKMDTKGDFGNVTIEIHDDGSKELDAGLRPLDHYKQVTIIPPIFPPGNPEMQRELIYSVLDTSFRCGSQSSHSCDGRHPTWQTFRYPPPPPDSPRRVCTD